MNGRSFSAGGSFVSLRFSPFCLCASSNAPYVPRAQRGEIWSERLYPGRALGLRRGERWAFGEGAVDSGAFARRAGASGVQQLPGWALKADFVSLYHDPGIPSPDTKQLFAFCQHALPLGAAAPAGSSTKRGSIYSLTSCEQQVGVIATADQTRRRTPREGSGLLRSKE